MRQIRWLLGGCNVSHSFKDHLKKERIGLTAHHFNTIIGFKNSFFFLSLFPTFFFLFLIFFTWFIRWFMWGVRLKRERETTGLKVLDDKPSICYTGPVLLLLLLHPFGSFVQHFTMPGVKQRCLSNSFFVQHPFFSFPPSQISTRVPTAIRENPCFNLFLSPRKSTLPCLIRCLWVRPRVFLSNVCRTVLTAQDSQRLKSAFLPIDFARYCSISTQLHGKWLIFDSLYKTR